jgi:hypothetical protein
MEPEAPPHRHRSRGVVRGVIGNFRTSHTVFEKWIFKNGNTDADNFNS